jgi:hypothetical protein
MLLIILDVCTIVLSFLIWPFPGLIFFLRIYIKTKWSEHFFGWVRKNHLGQNEFRAVIVPTMKVAVT